MQARRRAQPSGTNSPSSSHPRSKHRARCAIFCPCPPCGRQGRPGEGFLAGSNIRAAGERPPRARPQRRGSPGPIPNPAVKPAFAESTAARGCGRAGRRARGGRFSMLARLRARGDVRRRAACAARGPRGDLPPAGLFCVSCSFSFLGLLAIVLVGLIRRRARSGNLPPCEPFLRYEVERCLPDASLVLIQNEFAVSTVGYVGGFGCYLIVYET